MIMLVDDPGSSGNRPILFAPGCEKLGVNDTHATQLPQVKQDSWLPGVRRRWEMELGTDERSHSLRCTTSSKNKVTDGHVCCYSV